MLAYQYHTTYQAQCTATTVPTHLITNPVSSPCHSPVCASKPMPRESCNDTCSITGNKEVTHFTLLSDKHIPRHDDRPLGLHTSPNSALSFQRTVCQPHHQIPDELKISPISIIPHTRHVVFTPFSTCHLQFISKMEEDSILSINKNSVRQHQEEPWPWTNWIIPSTQLSMHLPPLHHMKKMFMAKWDYIRIRWFLALPCRQEGQMG